MYRDLTLNQLVDKFGDLTPQIVKWLGAGGMRVPTRASGTGGLMVGVSEKSGTLEAIEKKYGKYIEGKPKTEENNTPEYKNF